MRSSFKIAAVSSVLLCVTLMAQNCGVSKNTNHEYPASPFEESKLLLSQDFAKQQKLVGPDGVELQGSAVIPKGTELSVIVRDACIRERIDNVAPVPYWVDGYITKDTPLGSAADLYAETAVGVITKAAFTVDQLNSYSKLDRCIVGVSNTTKIAYRTATNPASTAADLLNALQFPAGDSVFKNEIPASIKVRVAILDSGLDYNNTALASKVDTSYSNYYNFLSSMVGVTASKGNQDVFGTGTQLASLIAGDSERSLTGLASRNVVLLPIKIRNDINQTFGSYQYLNMIKLAVNMRADVINLATSDVTEGCDPIVGHAMLQAVRRNAFLVLSAGDNIEPMPSKPRRPGAFVTVKDNGPLYTGVTVAPGCWGRYLKGAVTVAAANTAGTALATFSNWGEDAVEIAAPGLSIRSVHHTKALVNSDSIVLPTAMVSASAVMAIAYHKAKAWSYDPWLIEDVMLNSMPTKTELISKIRRGKFLSFSALANYLKMLESKTQEQRLAEVTDNPELNGGWNATAAVETSLMSIDVYAKNPVIQIGKRIQLNTVAYYTDAVIKVITEAGTSYSSSNSAVATVNSQGVLVAKAPGNVTISASYNGKKATTNVSIVSYDVIEGPRNDLVGLEMAYSLLNKNNCPIGGAGDNWVFYPQAYAVFGDGSRSDVSSLSSYAAPRPAEISSLINGNTVIFGNWYGGKTYTFYGLYRGQQAKLDIVGPKVPYKRATVGYSFGSGSGAGSVATNGSTITVSQDKNLVLRARIEVADDCVFFPIKNDINKMTPKEVFSSPDPDLSAQLLTLDQWSNGLNLYKLTPGKTYQLNVNFGAYRGNGTHQAVPAQTYYLKVLPPDIKDLYLVENFGSKLPSPFPMGFMRVNIQMEDSAGQKQILNPQQFSAQFVERSSGRILRAPEGIAYTQAPYHDMMMYMFPPAGDSTAIDLVLTHLQTGFKKTFNFSSSGLNRFSGSDKDAPAFNWNNFSMSALANLCPNGASTGLSGNGSQASPYIICSPQQMITVGQMTTDIRKAPYVVLGTNINFSGVTFPKKTLMFQDLDGGGKTISNIVYASADETTFMFTTQFVSDVVFSNFSIATRKALLIAAGTLENVRFQNGLISANDGSANLMGSSSGDVQMRLVKNIRVENVELQGTSSIAPITDASALRVENFGARKLTIRSSSVAGTGNFIGGIVPMCSVCTIVSSSTSGSISQVAHFVGGIVGQATISKLISVSSDMNIAATGADIGGIAGRLTGSRSYPTSDNKDESGWTLIYNSSFKGSVRGKNNVGGLVGAATYGTIENSFVGASSPVQGVENVGGAIGASLTFNRLYDVTVDASIYSENTLHPISNSIVQSGFTFRPADRFSNLKFKGYQIQLDPALVPSALASNASIGTMPAPASQTKTMAQLGVTVSVEGATLSGDTYILNLGTEKKGTIPKMSNLQIKGASPFYIAGMSNSVSISLTNGTLSSSGGGFTNWNMGVGLPTNRVGNINNMVVITLRTAAGQTEIKIQVRGTVID